MKISFEHKIDSVQLIRNKYNVFITPSRKIHNYILRSLRASFEVDILKEGEPVGIKPMEGNILKRRDVLYITNSADELNKNKDLQKALLTTFEQKMEASLEVQSKLSALSHSLFEITQNLDASFTNSEFNLEYNLEISNSSLLKILSPSWIRSGDIFQEFILDTKIHYINFMLEHSNPKIIIVEYPEQQLSKKEQRLFADYLSQLPITTLILTNELPFLIVAHDYAQIHYISKYGKLHKLQKFFNESLLFTNNKSSLHARFLSFLLDDSSEIPLYEQRLLHDICLELNG